MAEPKVHPAATPSCTICSCLCHDVRFDVENPDCRGCRSAENAAFWIQAERKNRPRLVLTVQDLDTTSHWLTDAVRFNRTIAFTGLESASCEVQNAAIALAETVGAWVVGHSRTNGSRSPWAAALAQKGCIQASWSEIRQRSDSLLLWYADLQASHPRWVERFGPRSQRAHRLAVVAPSPGDGGFSGKSPEEPGLFPEQIIRIDPGKACEFLRAVRAALQNDSIEPAASDVRKVVHLIRNARWLAIVRSTDPPGLADPFGTAETFADLVATANQEGTRRVVATFVPSKINEAGLGAILSMKTGLTTPLRFTADGPAQDLGEWSSEDVDLLVRFHDHLVRWGWYGEKFCPGGSGERRLRFHEHERDLNRARSSEGIRRGSEKGMKRKLIELSIKMGFFDKGEGSRTESEDSRTLVRGGTIRCIDVPLLQWGVYATGTLIREDGVPVPVRGLEGGNSPDLSGFLHAVRKEVRTRLAAATSGEEPDFAAGESVPGAFR